MGIVYFCLNMDTNFFFSIRNTKTHEQMGWKEKVGGRIYIPINGEMENFIAEYNASKNYYIGNAVELYDVDKQLVDHFAVLYSFKYRYLSTLADVIEYDILEETLSNLEMLEIIDKSNKKESFSVDHNIDISPK